MAWVLALIVVCTVGLRELAVYRFGGRRSSEAVVPLINTVAIGAGSTAAAVLFWVQGFRHTAVLCLLAGLSFLTFGAHVVRRVRARPFDPACQAVNWHKQYERCEFCRGLRFADEPAAVVKAPCLVNVAMVLFAGLAFTSATAALRPAIIEPLLPGPDYRLDLAAEDIPGIINNEFGHDTVTSCEMDDVDRFVCDGGPDRYCYLFEIGPTGERDLETGRTHYRDYKVRYLMIAEVPTPADQSLYVGTPYLCRKKDGPGKVGAE